MGVYPSLRSRIGPPGASRARSLGIVFSGIGPPARRAGGFQVGGFLSGIALVGGIFGGVSCLRVVAPKSGLWARSVGLTRRGGQRYAVGLPEVGRWFLGRDVAVTEF